MFEAENSKNQKKHRITVEEVNRILEIGRLLFSILTQEEIEELQSLLNGGDSTQSLKFVYTQNGNTGVS